MKLEDQLLLGRKAMTNPDSVWKSKDITLPTKICIVKVMGFPVVMYRSESWTVKKTEHWRIDPFELCCWRKLLRVPWTARRSNQSILKENQPWILIGRTDAEYFGYLMQRASSMEKTLMLVKIEARRREWQRMRWLDGNTDSMDMNLGKLQEMVRNREAWHTAVHRVPKSWTPLGDWTKQKWEWRIKGYIQGAFHKKNDMIWWQTSERGWIKKI